METFGTQRDAGRRPKGCRDDEKACGGDEPLHLFSLPIELRHRIYELVFGKGLVLRPQESDDEEKSWTTLVDVAIFRVNKSMRNEAMGWFFANNGFVLNYDQTGSGGVVRSFFRKNSHGQRPWLLENLKRLRIEIVLHRGNQRQDVENTIIEICDVLANCTRILKIRIHLFLTSHISIPAPARCDIWMNLLERFCCLRGVGNVMVHF